MTKKIEPWKEIYECSLGVICDCVEAKAEEIEDWMYSETSQVFTGSLTLYALARGLEEIRAVSPDGICDDANTP